MFGRMKFWLLATNLTILSQNLCCKQRKEDRVINVSFRLHGEFYAKKYLKVFLWNPWNVLTRMHRRKKRHFCTYLRRDNQIATSAKLLDITYESYGFSADLIETIN